jgi:mannitol-1-phosphate 5-dehydrogenase
MKTIVQFGAGSIGRSLVGNIFSRAGYEVVFVDIANRLIDELNNKHRYLIRVKDEIPPGDPDEIWVENVRGIHAVDTEAIIGAVEKANIISTAVGAGALPRALGALAGGLVKRRRPVSILLCENLRSASSIAYEALKLRLPGTFDMEKRVGLVETSIGKMVPIMPAEITEKAPLEVWAEVYNRLLADREGFVDGPPHIEGLELKKNFAAFVDRKLFIHNLGHAAAAYHGFLKGYTYIWECLADDEVRKKTEATMWETGRALISRYPEEFDDTNQAEHVNDLLRRFANRVLGDTVYRVGRDLQRKLSPNDRCIGGLHLAASEGISADNICATIVAAFKFKARDENGEMYPGDVEFHRLLEEKGREHMLLETSGLDPDRDARWGSVILNG